MDAIQWVMTFFNENKKETFVTANITWMGISEKDEQNALVCTVLCVTFIMISWMPFYWNFRFISLSGRFEVVKTMPAREMCSQRNVKQTEWMVIKPFRQRCKLNGVHYYQREQSIQVFVWLVINEYDVVALLWCSKSTVYSLSPS